MPSCCNSAGNCTCKITGGAGVTTTGTGTLADPVIVSAQKAAINHGSVSGTVSVSADYGLHEMTLTAAVTLAPSGAIGEDTSVLIHANSKAINLSGATWYTAAPGITTDLVTVTFAHFPTGWYGYVAEFPAPVTVTPAAVTFTDGSNTITVPSQVGVQYLKDGSVLTAGANAGYPAGGVIVVAEATSGYVIAGGATTSWSHTFGALTAAPIAPTAITTGSNQLWFDASASGALTMASTKVTTWRNDGLTGTGNNLTQGTDANRPLTTTINSKTAVLCTAVTTTMQKTSITPGGLDTLPLTMWGVVRIDAVPSQRTLVGGSYDSIRSNGTAGQIDTPGTAPAKITLTSAFTNGQVIFVAARLQSGAASTLWSGSNSTSATQAYDGGMVHLFMCDFTGALCEFGVFDGAVSDAEIAGLYAYAKAKWNTV